MQAELQLIFDHIFLEKASVKMLFSRCFYL